MWIAYDRLSPIGDWRGDVQAAQVSASVFNARGGKANIADLLLKWGRGEEEREEASELEKWISDL